MIHITLSLLLFFVTATVVDAQELGFPEGEAVNLSQGFNPNGQEFGDKNYELAEGESSTMTPSSGNSKTDNDVQSTDPRSRSSMLAGFVQFFSVMAVAGVAIVGWIIYRNKQVEYREHMRDNWG